MTSAPNPRSLASPPQPSRWPLILGTLGVALALTFGGLVWFQEPLFHWALKREDIRQVEWWLRFNPKLSDTPDKNNNYPLWKALESPHHSEKLVKILLKADADPNQANIFTYMSLTPLGIAIVSKKSLHLTQMFLEAGADPSEPRARRERSPLYVIIASLGWRTAEEEKIREQLFKMLVDAGAELQAPGYSPLALAMTEVSPKWVQKLLDAGADPNTPEVREAVGAYIWMAFVERHKGVIPPQPEGPIILEMLAEAGFDFDALGAIPGAESQGALQLMRDAGLEHLLAISRKKRAASAAQPAAETP
jgi:hypothetical protein